MARSSVAIVTASLARRVAAAGNRTVIIAGDAGAARSDPGLRSIELIQVPAVGTRLFQAREFLSGQSNADLPVMASDRYFGGYFENAIRTLQAWQPDIVHIPTSAQFVPRIAAALPKAKIVLHLHDELLAHLRTDWLETRLEDVARVVCVNSHIRDAVSDRVRSLQHRFSVLHNGVDASLSGSRPPRATRHRRLVYAARLSPEKGLHIFAEALGRMKDFKDLNVELIGSPGLMPRDWLRMVSRDDAICRSLLELYGSGFLGGFRSQILGGGNRYVEDSLQRAGSRRACFQLCGFLPHAALLDRYAGATAVICPSVCNEVSMSAYEGMACGLPAIVSYDRPNDGPLRDGETALVVRRADPDDLARAIETILSDPEKVAKMGTAAKRMMESFTWDRAGKKLLDIYDALPGR